MKCLREGILGSQVISSSFSFNFHSNWYDCCVHFWLDFETKQIDDKKKGTRFVTTATPVQVCAVVDFYSGAAVKVTRGNVQDQYVHSLSTLAVSTNEGGNPEGN